MRRRKNVMAQKANIKFCFKLGKKCTALTACPVRKFIRGRNDLNNDPRPDRPVTVATKKLLKTCVK